MTTTYMIHAWCLRPFIAEAVTAARALRAWADVYEETGQWPPDRELTRRRTKKPSLDAFPDLHRSKNLTLYSPGDSDRPARISRGIYG